MNTTIIKYFEETKLKLYREKEESVLAMHIILKNDRIGEIVVV